MIEFGVASFATQNPYVPSGFLTSATVVCSIIAKALASPLILSRSPPNFLCSHAQLILIGGISTIGKKLPDVGDDIVIIEISYGGWPKLKYLITIFIYDVRPIARLSDFY